MGVSMNIRDTNPITRGFRVLPAENGGWIVTIEDNSMRGGEMRPMSAAVSTDEDLLEYLAEQLGV